MAKQIKKASTKKTEPVNTLSARTFLLAGLGVAARVQRQGRSLFSACVADGRQVQDRGSQLAHSLGQRVATQARSRWLPVQGGIDQLCQRGMHSLEQNVGRVLSRAGIPSKVDVDALSTRIDALSRKIRAAA